MHEFPFKDLDKEGLDTLLAISKADAFNKWMYDAIAPFLKGNILEIGSGIGNISRYFIHDGKTITLSDIRTNYLDYLTQHYRSSPFVKGIEAIDLVKADFKNQYEKLLLQFDSVFALNVVEHIKDDTEALVNLTKLVKPGGTVLILVPANKWLYNGLDKELHHYRRYSARELESRMASAGVTDIKSSYFNALGAAGWMLNGSLLRKRIITADQMSVFNKLVPAARLIDSLVKKFLGLSLIVTAQKPL
jgi:2-polyprenyl-3-methyl-5-hydroxy-6-metoxy-1,4-benzoquinol methylase